MKLPLKPRHLLILITILAAFLRFNALSSTPPSLNLDEVAIGYNAYSILKTGKDEFGDAFPIAFRSHDDYKAPFYIYLTAISEAVFGLNEFAVRLPSAFFGTVTIPLVFLLCLQLFDKHQHKFSIALLSSFLLTISPWHLQFSRAAFETNVAVFFVALGFWAYLKGLKQTRYWLITATAFAISLYTYHTTKLFIPLICLFLALRSKKIIQSNFKLSLAATALFFILISPLIPFMLSPQGRLRFKGTNVFQTITLVDKNHDWKLEQWRIGRPYQAKVFHNEQFYSLITILKGYFTHFSYDFLFHGEAGPPKNYTPNIGLLYLWELPVLIIGFYSLYHKKYPFRHFLLFWVLISPIASSLTWDVPSSTRTTIILPSLQIITAIGIVHLFTNSSPKIRKTLSVSFPVVILFFFFNYLHNYYRIAPTEYAHAWQYGYKQAVLAAQKYQDSHDQVIVSTKLKQPQNFFAFYLKYDPQTYIKIDGGTVSGGFNETENKFGKYSFKPIEWDKEKIIPNTLYVEVVENKTENYQTLETINDAKGQPIINLVSTGMEETH